MKKVVHLIPCNVIGGVEIAAKEIDYIDVADVSFNIEYISNIERKNNIFSIYTSVRKLLASNTDILIVSLWRSCVVGFLVKIFRKNIKLVVFLHSARSAHFIEYVLTSLALLVATEVWSDSSESITQRMIFFKFKKTRIISFKLQNIGVVTSGRISLNFIYWGRISREKGLDRALRIFYGIHSNHNHAKFIIVGPDSGMRPALQEICRKLNIEDSVIFTGELNFNGISALAKKSCFYLQTSSYEGASMSVMEAMQLGLVPIVTPVGEIKNYCKNGKNSVIVINERDSINEILGLINSESKFQIIYNNSVNTWKSKPLYADSILAACRDI